MPADVLAKLNTAINKALQDSELKTVVRQVRIDAAGHDVARGAAFTKSEYEKWKKVIADGHITLD